MKKKIVALLLAMTMTVSLVACANNNDTKDTETKATEAAGVDTTEGTETADDSDIVKPEKIKIMIDGTVFTKPNARDAFQARWEELTGIELEITQPDHDAYYDVVGQTLASGDWPDVMILASTYYTGYAAEDVLWDMTDAWENSELKASGRFTGESVIDGLKIDGSLYGFAPTRGNGCVTYVKESWLENVGLEPPTNYEQFIEMLDAFTNGDPDGNGVDGDTYAVASAGIIGPEAPFTNYLPEFYQDARPAFYVNDSGEWVDGFTEDAMKDALTRLQEAYVAGYIDQESLTNGTADCRNKFYEDKFGVFTYWAGTWNTNLKTNLEANEIDGRLIALEPIEELGTYLERVPPVWAITTTCENPEGVFKYFIETMLDGGELQFLWTYGVEDVHWSRQAGEVLGKTFEEGEFHMLENLENAGTLYTKHHIDPTISLGTFTTLEDPRENTLAEEAKASSTLFNNNSRMADLAVTTEAMSQYNGDLQTLKNEIIASIVVDGVSVEEGMATFESRGGAEWSALIVESLNK